ncbi:hypothetical protein Acr_17g0008690 [Actinidia rufa]|uniref:Reverse transcriptase Ty1/copia-type domain-containing protein n=1 Tax=Actinidia rufa TaxID=165716 RepID=A0A7J0G3E4_9ERIC|nr:hypothetical protein Acr_17g0008690 [Actinidia rufa]
MALVAHFDLELHQMDVKTAFLNGNIDETIYMVQPENFVSGDSKSMVYKLKKSIYGLKQASRQWYHKFHQVITSYGFEANVVDNCVYHKFSGSKYIFLVLYVDDILLASSDIGLLHEAKRFLTKKFEMKDLGDASFVLVGGRHLDTSFMLAGGAISWKSAEQTLIASSTMAVEFVACYEASNHGIWLRNFVTGLRVVDGIDRPLKIYCDNNSAVHYSNNNRSSTKSKYIDIKFLVVKERVQDGQISL